MMIYVPIDYQLMSRYLQMMNKRAFKAILIVSFRVDRGMYEIGGPNEMIHEPAQEV